MVLNLKEITINNNGQVQEKFETNSPRIKDVTFTYSGKEKDLDSFLKSLMLERVKNNQKSK